MQLLDLPESVLAKIFEQLLHVSWHCINFPICCKKTLPLLELAKKTSGIAILAPEKAYCHAQSISIKRKNPLWFLKLAKPRLLHVICTNPKNDKNVLVDSHKGQRRHIDPLILGDILSCFPANHIMMFFDSKPIYKVWRGQASFPRGPDVNFRVLPDHARQDGVYCYFACQPYSRLLLRRL